MKSKYTEEDLQYALDNVRNGLLVRQAGLKWGIPRSIIQDKIYGYLSHAETTQPSQKLS
jgi:helix-turn-helix, Psq domain